MNKLLLSFGLLFILSLSAQAQRPVLKDVTAEQMRAEINRLRTEKPLLVNFWATWCGPCKEEFPYLMDLKKQYGDKFTLVFVSGDFEEAREEAIEFLESQGVDFVTYFKTGSDDEFIRAMSPKWNGALPFTMYIDQSGKEIDAWEGKADFETFRKALLKLIKN